MPTMVGDYQIVGRLGGGAMAELFLAHKMSRFGFIRRAVVKRVRRSRPDYHQLQEMLLDEARATACFDHPNLVSLFDVGETEQGIYLALEYVEGSDLRRVNAKLRARKEALPFELAVFITVEVLRGLHHAHTSKDQDGRSLEIVHRDVNPSNVLIARSGHVKLADFGVVRMRERVQQKTEPGLVKGKYAYLAPEYIAGERCSVQTDMYAAGIMLFELLSGRECFSGKTAYEVMWKIVNKGVPMYRLEREGVPEDLQRIVQRATAMAPERRYQSAQDMANALEAWLMRSGRHATPWVLSVFFHRHDLLPARRDTSKIVPLAHLSAALEPSRPPVPRPSGPTPGTGITPGSPRVVESTMTPLPSELADATLPDRPLTPAGLPEGTGFESASPIPSGLSPLGEGPFGSSRSPSPLAATQPLEHLPQSSLAGFGSRPFSPVALPGATGRPHAPAPGRSGSPSSWINLPEPSSVQPGSSLGAPPRGWTGVDRLPGSSSDGASIARPPPRSPPPPPISGDGVAGNRSTGETPVAASSATPLPRNRFGTRASDPGDTPPRFPPASAAESSWPDDEVPRPARSGGPETVTPARAFQPGAEMPAPIVLTPDDPPQTGKLEEVSAVDLLECLAEGGHTGVIEFRCGLIWKKVKMFDGRPMSVSSNMGLELIGEHLVKSRIITRDQLHKALQRSEREGRPLTTMLIEDGALDRDVLEDELGNNLGARLHDVLAWRWGTFELKAETVKEAEYMPRLDLRALLERAREARLAERGTLPKEESGEFDAQRKLEKAIDIARSIASSSGKGQIERPWRPEEG